MKFEIKHVTQEDRERVLEFNRLVHPDSIDIIERIIFKNPFRKGEEFCYLEQNGEIVSFSGLIPHRQRWGGGEIMVGEVGVVGTHPQYRNKGFASYLTNYWLDYMHKQSIPVSFLYGIPGFYERFDYYYAVPDHSYNYVRVNTNLLKRIVGAYSIQPLDFDDLNEVAVIFANNSAKNQCSEIRIKEYWRYRIDLTNFGAHRWYSIKDEGEVKGYLWLTASPTELTVRESGICDEEAARSAAAFLYRLAVEGENDTIGLKCPLNNPFARFLYRRGAGVFCPNEIYPGSWAGMYRIINLKAALAGLGPLLQERIAGSRFYRYKGIFCLATDVGGATFVLDGGKLHIDDYNKNRKKQVKLSASILTPMLTGYKGAEEWAQVNYPDREAADFFKAIFPTGYPYIWDLEISDELR